MWRDTGEESLGPHPDDDPMPCVWLTGATTLWDRTFEGGHCTGLTVGRPEGSAVPALPFHPRAVPHVSSGSSWLDSKGPG